MRYILLYIDPKVYNYANNYGKKYVYHNSPMWKNNICDKLAVKSLIKSI